MVFNKNYNKVKNNFQKELNIIENKMITKVSIAEPLYGSIVEFLQAPSKRIRSLISMIYYKAICEKELNEAQLEFLSDIELIHNASLIHDDIIDESKIRRGMDTIHSKFNTKLGVITGDYLIAVAIESLARLNCSEIISTIIKEMCKGEISQNFDRFKIPTIEKYIEKSRNKTGLLFESSISTTIKLGDCKNYNATDCQDFAYNLGIAFQINDDLKNFISNDTQKPYLNDIENGIYTAPIIFAKNIENLSTGIEKTKGLLNNYLVRVINSVKLLPDNEYRKQLEELFEND